MTQLIQLTDAEIAAVGGGAITQSISLNTHQTNTSTVTQTAIATNSGAVHATATGTGATAVAAGAVATNIALVSQENVVLAANNIRF